MDCACKRPGGLRNLPAKKLLQVEQTIADRLSDDNTIAGISRMIIDRLPEPARSKMVWRVICNMADRPGRSVDRYLQTIYGSSMRRQIELRLAHAFCSHGSRTWHFRLIFMPRLT